MSPIPTIVTGAPRSEVAPHLAQMALGRFPRAARGDAELLVIVTVRAARSESVAQPEAPLLGQPVGHVGERRGSLVGRHHQVCAVVVEHLDARRMRHFAIDDIVGQIQHRVDQSLVCLDHFLRTRRPGVDLTINPPLAPTGTMIAFLTVCVFIRSRISVRKSSGRSLQRIPPRATLPARRWHPCIRGLSTWISYSGATSGRSSDLRALEFQHDIGNRMAQRLEVVGAHRRLGHRQHAPRDAVVVDVVHRGQRLGDRPLASAPIRRGVSRSGCIRATKKSTNWRARLRIAEKHPAQRRPRRSRFHLKRRRQIGAQQRHLAPAKRPLKVNALS